MAGKALVMGGGGTLGIAWMIGLSAALANGDVRLSEAELFVGTSAGSAVSTLLAYGMDPGQLAALAQGSGGLPAAMVEKVATGVGLTEAEWVGIFSGVLGEAPWPERPLRISAVEAATGELVFWTRASGVPVARAIASSCSVPNLLPPVTINGRQYIDGGVRSGTHANQALGHDRVLIVAPMGAPRYTLGHEMLGKERAELEAAGAQVMVVLPDAATEQAFGDNLMEPARAGEALVAGLQQGMGLAAELKAFWL